MSIYYYEIIIFSTAQAFFVFFRSSSGEIEIALVL